MSGCPPSPPSRRPYPFELYHFDDGVFIRRAARSHAALVGARVVGYGTVSIDDALAAAGTTVSADNDLWRRGQAPRRLSLPSVARGLGLTGDPDAIRLILDRNGRRDTVRVAAVPAGDPHAHGGMWPPPDWVDMASSPPLWRQEPHRLWWTRWLPETGTLYVVERGIEREFRGETHAAFWRATLSRADSLPVRRLVLDLRENMGGNAFLARDIVRGLIQRPALNRPGGFYVITGRDTFSAAMNLVNELEYYTAAAFVGEPTGSSPRSFGDHRPLHLPASGLTVMVSAVWHDGHDPHDQRRFVPPRVHVPATAAAYATGRDEVLEAVLADDPSADPVARLADAAHAGRIADVAAILPAARAQRLHQFRNFEPEVNALGYELLRRGGPGPAIPVFEANAAAYPGSANVWDSLGEALAVAGRIDEARAAYRRALTIDPGFTSSREALARLDAGHPPP